MSGHTETGRLLLGVTQIQQMQMEVLACCLFCVFPTVFLFLASSFLSFLLFEFPLLLCLFYFWHCVGVFMYVSVCALTKTFPLY